MQVANKEFQRSYGARTSAWDRKEEKKSLAELSRMQSQLGPDRRRKRKKRSIKDDSSDDSDDSDEPFELSDDFVNKYNEVEDIFGKRPARFESDNDFSDVDDVIPISKKRRRSRRKESPVVKKTEEFEELDESDRFDELERPISAKATLPMPELEAEPEHKENMIEVPSMKDGTSHVLFIDKVEGEYLLTMHAERVKNVQSIVELMKHHIVYHMAPELDKDVSAESLDKDISSETSEGAKMAENKSVETTKDKSISEASSSSTSSSDAPDYYIRDKEELLSKITQMAQSKKIFEDAAALIGDFPDKLQRMVTRLEEHQARQLEIEKAAEEERKREEEERKRQEALKEERRKKIYEEKLLSSLNQM